MAGEIFIPSYLGDVTLARDWAAGVADPTSPDYWWLQNSRVVPYNLMGNSYPGIIDGGSYPSVSYVGKRRPGFTLFFYAKPSTITSEKHTGFDSVLLNAALINMSAVAQFGGTGVGTNLATDRFWLKLDNKYVSRIWGHSRCTNIIISGGASGGPVVIQMGFFSRWGHNSRLGTNDYPTTQLPDGETVTAPTWPAVTGYTAAVAGQLAGVVDYDFRSDALAGNAYAAGNTWTANQVRSFVLHLMRGQGPVDYIDGTKHCKEIASGKLSGVLQIDQNPAATTVPATGATLRLFTNSQTNGLKITMLLQHDSTDHTMEVGIEGMTSNYALIDTTSGGNPVVATTYASPP